jgi:hypothetical protein
MSFFISAPALAHTTGGATATTGASADAVAAGTAIDKFEDEGQSLEIVTSGGLSLADTALTLVYRDENANVRRVTVQADSLSAQGASALDAFLGTIDPDFLSYVRAVVGDHVMHLAAGPSALEWAKAAMFFPSARGKTVGGSAPRHGEESSAAQVTVEFVPNAID